MSIGFPVTKYLKKFTSMQLNCFVVWSLIKITESTTTFTNFIPRLLKNHFSDERACNYYFCRKQDAVLTWKTFRNRDRIVNVRALSSVKSNEGLTFNFFKPQTIGVFLDLSCEEGTQLLEQSLQMFNGTYRWLIWDPNFNQTLASLTSSRISLDSDVTFLIPNNKVLDIYRIHHLAPWVVTDIGNWTEDGGIITMSLPERKNFKGYNFNTSLLMQQIEFNKTISIEPFLDRSYEMGIDNTQRLTLSLFMHVAEYFNFTMTYLKAHAWGDPQENGYWPGMIGQVVRGEAEFGTAAAKFNMERYPVIDYVFVVQLARYCFTFIQPKKFGAYTSLFIPFDASVWTGLGIAVVVGILAFRAVSKHDKTSLHNENWSGSVLLVLSSVAQQGFPDNTYQLSTRLIYLSLLWVTFLSGVYYNTSILNGILLQAPNAIQNIEQLLDSDIKLRLFDSPYIIFEMANWDDPLTVRVRRKLQKIKPPDKLAYGVKEGVQLLRKGYALYTKDEVLYTEILETASDLEVCSLTEVEKYRPYPAAMVAGQNSPYKEAFVRVYNLMAERGVLNRLNNHWMIQKPECHFKQEAAALGVEPLFLAYLVLGIGVFLASGFFVGECFFKKKSKTFNMNLKIIHTTNKKKRRLMRRIIDASNSIQPFSA